MNKQEYNKPNPRTGYGGTIIGVNLSYDKRGTFPRIRQLTPEALKESARRMTFFGKVCLAVAVLVAALGGAAAPAQAAGSVATVTVQAGDSLSVLAARYGGSVGAWKYTNGLESDQILVGQKLSVPMDGVFRAEGLRALFGTTMGMKEQEASVEQASRETKQSKTVASVEQNAVAAAPTVAGMRYSRVLDMSASAYGPGNVNWAYGGHTYSGTKVREGVIAVDPKVIPLGTKLWITGYETPLLPAGGFVAVAEDVGGLIKGNRIDIYCEGTQAQLRAFGKQGVKVYVLE